jgi:hypothetical protein
MQAGYTMYDMTRAVLSPFWWLFVTLPYEVSFL